MQRRQFLSLASFFALSQTLLAATRRLTPVDVEGPFYPINAIPLRSNLINDAKLNDLAIQLKGHVIDREGKPIVGATVEIWQCDEKGIYDHPAQSKNETFNTGFLGFGSHLTDNQGAYTFTTLHPVPYTGRPPHIHVKVWNKNKQLLTTQLYLEDKIGGNWYKRLRKPLLINPKSDADGQIVANFTFVV